MRHGFQRAASHGSEFGTFCSCYTCRNRRTHTNYVRNRMPLWSGGPSTMGIVGCFMAFSMLVGLFLAVAVIWDLATAITTLLVVAATFFGIVVLAAWLKLRAAKKRIAAREPKKAKEVTAAKAGPGPRDWETK